MKKYALLIAVACLGTGCITSPPDSSSSTQGATYEKDRFQEMKHILETRRDELRGIPLDQFITTLGIKDTPWDENYTNQPFHSRRTYHLGGFFLDLSIEHKDDQLFTDSHFYPGLHADGLTRQLRLDAQKQKLSEYFKERAALHERHRKEIK